MRPSIRQSGIRLEREAHKRPTGPSAPLLLLLFIVAVVPLLAQDEKPQPQDCEAWDQRFAFSLNWLGILFAGAIAGVVLPFAVPNLLRFRAYFLLRPIQRWILIAGASTLIAGALWVGCPAGAAAGSLPQSSGLLVYPGVDPRYFSCSGVDFAGSKVLFGFLGQDRAPVVAQPGAMGAAFAVGAVFWAVVYWVVHRILR